MVCTNETEDFYDFSFCNCINRKKLKLKKSGYIVDRPRDFSYEKYGSIRTHGFWDVKVYYNYGSVYYLDENDIIRIHK